MIEDELRRELELAKVEIAHLRGWKQGAEEGIEHLRKEVEYWKTMALRATADEKRVKELEAALEAMRNALRPYVEGTKPAMVPETKAVNGEWVEVDTKVWVCCYCGQYGEGEKAIGHDADCNYVRGCAALDLTPRPTDAERRAEAAEAAIARVREEVEHLIAAIREARIIADECRHQTAADSPCYACFVRADQRLMLALPQLTEPIDIRPMREG